MRGGLEEGRSIKTWLRQLGLQAAYNKRERECLRYDCCFGNDEDEHGGNSIIRPGGFEFLFCLAGYLFPGFRYHQRLFARRGTSAMSVLRILRDQIQKDPTNPLFSWHQKERQWTPPTKEALIHTIEIIRRF